jgi:hypothetical protein
MIDRSLRIFRWASHGIPVAGLSGVYQVPSVPRGREDRRPQRGANRATRGMSWGDVQTHIYV